MALGFNAMGGVGCISVTANVAPKLCSEFQKATREGRWDDALELQDRLYPLHAALFSDASPGPVKYALSRVRQRLPDGASPADDRALGRVEARGRCGARSCGADLSPSMAKPLPAAVRQAEGRRREPARALRLFRRGAVRGRDRAGRDRGEGAAPGRGLDRRKLCDRRGRRSVADQQPHSRIQPRQPAQP